MHLFGAASKADKACACRTAALYEAGYSPPSLAVMIGSCSLYCVKVRLKCNLMMNTILSSKYLHAWLVYR
jgi:hypothetical protein